MSDSGISTYTSGPIGAAVPLTREQQLEQAIEQIRSEVSWVEKRGSAAHRAAMERIRAILVPVTGDRDRGAAMSDGRYEQVRDRFVTAQATIDRVRRIAQDHLAAKFLDGDVTMSADDKVLERIIALTT